MKNKISLIVEGVPAKAFDGMVLKVDPKKLTFEFRSANDVAVFRGTLSPA